MLATAPRRWGPIKSLLALSPVLIGAPLYALHYQYTLPTPLTEQYNPITNLPQISESTILGYAKYLSEDIGYRTVGTKEHAEGDAWLHKEVQRLKEECDAVVKASGRSLECEVWRQEGSGSHRFDMMNKRLYKNYVSLSNIIFRISNTTLASKEHAVLVNSHLDSTLPSPGAADDAISVGVMMECIRVLINTPDWEPVYSIIFLFNNAEECLQDGSHLYSTQHETASTVRAAINLEAAGTTGRDLLFQATSEQMIEAYSHVPRPFGTILANEIFSSGVILSDTDFRQFEQYLNVTGLDMAIVGNSYLYHMRKDLVENIQPGSAQHFGENALALLLHLSSASSPLPSLTSGYTPPSTVFFSNLGFFVAYSYSTAKVMYVVLLGASVLLARATWKDPAPALRGSGKAWKDLFRGVVAVSCGAGGALVGANLVAFIMSSEYGLGKAMSWFSNEFSTVGLYGPAAFTGALASQLLLNPIPEQTMFTSLLLLQTSLSVLMQFAGIGSAGIFFLSSVPLFIGISLNAFIGSGSRTPLWLYALGQVMPLLTGAQIMAATLDVFVPLTGRIGADAPADHIIASIVATMGAYNFPLAIPFSHRFGRKVLARSVVLMVLVTGGVMAYFARREPFDSMHQKRLFVLHHENLQTHEQKLHLASADGAPGLENLVANIASEFGVAGVDAATVVMDDNNTDWNSLYPFSAFLSPYMVDLPTDERYAPPVPAKEEFIISTVNDKIDEAAGTRSFTLKVYHPGVIWTVIAFDAHVLKWTLDDSPPDEYARHHIKEASFYGQDTWTVDLTIRIPKTVKTPLKVDFIGIGEKRMWPGKKAEKEEGGRAMVLFEKLDEYVEESTDGTVDVLLLGCVGGQTEI